MIIDKLEAARIYWHSVLLEGMTYTGPTPALSESALASLADHMERRRVGHFDLPLSDEGLAAVEASKSVLRDVADLVEAGHIRLIEAKVFETPPTASEERKQIYIVASQILKTCKADLNPHFDVDEV